ncbi:MAG: ABC transporter ATP-binding protein/permease [candidate division KSB1 bacterium]|nr:ABC transporter ATP-binding protein/permease [candidate division KSB1 bacterium]MDZ7302410.1 ABC transporter ATP-binding protein/permease [candidate division KSB1 bacterium]MDZ7311612.1 ABC transporter ATP-binding protein/permease [candidate division KSB1 bacterium]
MSDRERNDAASSLTNPEPERISYKTVFRLYKVFGRHYKKHWKLLLAAYSALLLSILIALLSPWPLKLILDNVILRRPLPERFGFLSQWFGTPVESLLAGLVLSFILLRFLDSIVSFLHKVGLLTIGEKMANDIRQRIFAHLQRLSLSFHESSRSGDLVYRLTSDIGDIKTILVQVPDNLVYRLVTICSHLGLMLVLEWRLALIAFSVIPILYYYNRRLGSGVQSATKKKRSKESDVTSIISENVTAMALVQAYGREDLQQARFEAENRESMQSGITAMRLAKVFKRVSDILAACGTGAVVYYGGRLALEGTILPGTLVLFASYLRNLYSPIDKVALMLLDIAKAQVSGERLLELVECDMVMQDAPNAVPAPPFKGRIEFRNVSFGYQKDVEVLKDVSFVVEPGETVALVGHSGAGKSTLISLLLRFYDPQQGRILIDGHDLREFTLKSLRDQMTIVMQEARLFNKTVRENIGFGKMDATEDEIIRAAKLAQAHDFIMQMPEGYDTMIYEGGENLSGGQKQRINIARAIIRNTPILILDEPATALDAKAEAQIHHALRALTRGKTTFMIAHKFSTIASADKILVLEEGRLAGFGAHDDLMRTSRPYRELYELQFGRQLEYATAETGEIGGDGKLAGAAMEEVLTS